MTNQNPNYTEKPEGFFKKARSVQKGSATYFERPAPPVRDAATGHPIGKNGLIDWKRVIEQVDRDGI